MSVVLFLTPMTFLTPMSLRQHLGPHGVAGVQGVVVDDERAADARGHRGVVLDEGLLGQLEVVGCGDDHRVRPGLVGVVAEEDDLPGAARSGAGHDGDLPLRDTGNRGDHVALFLAQQAGELPRPSHGHEGVHAAVDKVLCDRFQALQVDLVVLRKGVTSAGMTPRTSAAVIMILPPLRTVVSFCVARRPACSQC